MSIGLFIKQADIHTPPMYIINTSCMCLYYTGVCTPQRCLYTPQVYVQLRCVCTPDWCLYTSQVYVHSSVVSVHSSEVSVHTSVVSVHRRGVCMQLRCLYTLEVPVHLRGACTPQYFEGQTFFFADGVLLFVILNKSNAAAS